MTPLNALTIDVEDYFQVSAFDPYVDRRDWDQHESRVVANTQRILNLLEEHNVKATFFVLGWVAERFPRLVQEIQRAGHEIGSHGYGHRLVYDLSPEEFRDDVRLSRSILQQSVDTEITAYRAPSFSITGRSMWALPILVEEGFRVDSSIFPMRHDRYGDPQADPHIHWKETDRGKLLEFPPAVVKWGPMTFPVSGGGYLRLFPLRWTLWGLRRINRLQGRPFMFYIHPWELDSQQPRISGASRVARFRHYANLSSTESKLITLLRTFRFGRVCDVLHAAMPGENGSSVN